MRPATVAGGDPARLAASTALLLAADAVDDHVRDREGPFRRAPLAAVGSRVATAWAAAGERAAAAVGFDPTALLAVGARQAAVEAGGVGAAEVSDDASLTATDRNAASSLGRAATLAEATVPTEDAVAAAFAHTATLAGRPGNVEPLSEAGRLLGRLAHLLDAVADRDEDRRAGRWNPLDATDTSTPQALARCAAAVRGIRAALRRVDLDPARDVARRLAHALLSHETARAVDRVAALAGHPAPSVGRRVAEIEWSSCRTGAADPPLAEGRPPENGLPAGDRSGRGPRAAVGTRPPLAGTGPREPEPIAPWDPSRAPGEPGDDEADEADEEGDDGHGEVPARPPGKQRGLLGGCAAAAGLCCTCRLCCADEFPGPWSGKPRQGWCSSCCDGCECGCDCCDCCDDCDGCCCSCD